MRVTDILLFLGWTLLLGGYVFSCMGMTHISIPCFAISFIVFLVNIILLHSDKKDLKI
jgi:hypothetical protein